MTHDVSVEAPMLAGVPTLASRIRAGESLAGLIVKMPSPAVIEIAGFVGLDFVIVDMEHGAGDTLALENHLRAADCAGIPALVRVPRLASFDMLRALDSGAQGLVVPRITNVEDVDGVVDSVFYPPVGRRGLALTTRAGSYGLADVKEHIQWALMNTVLIVQVEDAAAVPNTRSMAAHTHIDGVFIGTNDLSLSLGQPGDLDHPEVIAVVEEVVAATIGEGTALCVVASGAADAWKWRERGATMTVFPSSVLLAHALRELTFALRGPPASTS